MGVRWPEMFELGVLNEEAASNGLTGKHIVGGRVPRPRGGERIIRGKTSLVLNHIWIEEP